MHAGLEPGAAFPCCGAVELWDSAPLALGEAGLEPARPGLAFWGAGTIEIWEEGSQLDYSFVRLRKAHRHPRKGEEQIRREDPREAGSSVASTNQPLHPEKQT